MPKPLTFRRETVTPELCEEMLPLLRAHHDECRWDKEAVLQPNFHEYQRLESSGILRVFTARSGAFHELAAYAIFCVRPHVHYGEVHAVQDVLFMKPEWRAGHGFEFIRHCDNELKDEGAKVVYRHVTEARDYSPTLKRLGYEKIETTYARRFA